ncbi:MAG: ABC transporter permease subunit [Promethearchaeota archaeon]
MSRTLTEELEVVVLPQGQKNKPPSDNKFITAIVSPALIIFGISIFIPIAIGIIISLRNSQGSNFFGTQFVLTHYYNLLFFGREASKTFYQDMYQTLFFSIVSVSIEFIMGLGFALILNKKFKGRGLARATLLIPWAIPTVASATIFRYKIFAPLEDYGLVNSILNMLNMTPVQFFGPPGVANTLFTIPILFPFSPYIGEIEISTTMFTAIIIDVWKTTPFITLLILAALQIVPGDLHKAGDVAGASGWQKFRYITWPLIKPGIGIALIFRIMQALRVYDAIVIFQDPRVASMTVQAYNVYVTSQYGLASAIAVLLFAIIIVFAIIIFYFTRRRGKREKKRSKVEVSNVFGKSEETFGTEGYLEEIEFKEPRIKAPSERKIRWYVRKKKLKSIIFYVAVAFMCIFCAFPFIWVVLHSFRDPYTYPTYFEIIPKKFSIDAYLLLFQTSQFTGVSFGISLLNSLILAGLTVLLTLVVGSLIAYAIAKFDFPGKATLNSFIFSMNSLPPLIIIIPYFIQTAFLSDLIPFIQFQDNIFALVLPYAAFNLPLAVFVLIAFFNEVPEELRKAAKVDGASNFQIFRKVFLPLTIPGIFTCGILVFISSWNELLFARIFITSASHQTVPQAIVRFVFNDLSQTAHWDTTVTLMAATSLATVPLIIFVLIFQKKIISGLTRGAVKG